ncbi:MAG TPA: hypothetical protein IAA98_06825 [Candidatus Avipropionibacterium avicola]|uniref:HEAT repeat protein n=1 Tax=Candidatus Avipropionibacterium avicola TaxID=2840701 RepID=A0A9D1GX97_9ACTN|nr:hypothetical protein [Candidatus Avipropionibacterium avicola]
MPDPRSHAAGPAARARAAAEVLGAEAFANWCSEVLSGVIGFEELAATQDPDPRWLADGAWDSWGPATTWPERGLAYWPRVWAARSLLHQWHPVAEPAILHGLTDDHWRVREMCAKVAAAHALSSAADACAQLAAHDGSARVRIAALRAIGAVGEGEHAPALIAGREDQDPTVADAAASALLRLAERLDRPVASLLGEE